MDIGETLKSAIKQLMANKGRTILTMLGMFIGIGAVIMILALGSGMTKAMLDQFSEIGLGVFRISSKTEETENYITKEEVELIADMQEIECIAMANDEEGVVYNLKGDQFSCDIMGAQPDYINKIYTKRILAGRSLNNQDESAYAHSILIADSVAKALFGCGKDYDKVIGESVNLIIEKQPNTFTIIGVYDTKVASNLSKKDLERTIATATFYMPYLTLEQIMGLQEGVESIAGSVLDGYDQVSTTTRIGQILNKRHHLQDGYQITTQVQVVEMVKQLLNTVTLFISAVAGISLIVGGVGIMNIMLVTVKERTKEIGIRKALGAPNGVILKQFLVEALMLTVIAGLIGTLFGYVGAILIGDVINIEAQFTLGMILFATVTSVAIGVAFGVYPAYQAAKMDPIEALRAD